MDRLAAGGETARGRVARCDRIPKPRQLAVVGSSVLDLPHSTTSFLTVMLAPGIDQTMLCNLAEPACERGVTPRFESANVAKGVNEGELQYVLDGVDRLQLRPQLRANVPLKVVIVRQQQPLERRLVTGDGRFNERSFIILVSGVNWSAWHKHPRCNDLAQ